jgi:hypothetical protein
MIRETLVAVAVLVLVVTIPGLSPGASRSSDNSSATYPVAFVRVDAINASINLSLITQGWSSSERITVAAFGSTVVDLANGTYYCSGPTGSWFWNTSSQSRPATPGGAEFTVDGTAGTVLVAAGELPVLTPLQTPLPTGWQLLLGLIVGGVVLLVGAAIIAPRLGEWSRNRKSRGKEK